MLKAFLAALVAVVPFVSFAGSQNYDVKIEGMTCSSCAQKVTSELSKLPNVDAKSVKIVLSEKKALITVTEDNKEVAEQIKKAVETAGFKVTSLNVATAQQPSAKKH